MGIERNDKEQPLCPECGRPVWETDPSRGRYRIVHGMCVERRRERLRKLRRGRKMIEQAEELRVLNTRTTKAWLQLNRSIRERNETCYELDRTHLAWVRSDIRIAAMVMNLRSDLLDQAVGSGPDRKTDTGLQVDHRDGPQTNHEPLVQNRIMDQWATNEPVDRTVNHHWTMNHEPDHGPVNHRWTDTGLDREPVNHQRTDHELSDWVGTGPRSGEPINQFEDPAQALGVIWTVLGIGPIPVPEPYEPTAQELLDHDVDTLHQVLRELGQDNLNLIADLVGWNGERPWRFDRSITKDGTMNEDFRGQIEDPGGRSNFVDWDHDLEDVHMHIPIEYIIDRMWTQDATDEHRSPQQLREYKPNTQR